MFKIFTRSIFTLFLLSLLSAQVLAIPGISSGEVLFQNNLQGPLNEDFTVTGFNQSSPGTELQLTPSQGNWKAQLLVSQTFQRKEGLIFEGSIFISNGNYKAVMVGFHDGVTNGTEGIQHGLYFFDNGGGISVSARSSTNAQSMPETDYDNSSSSGSWFDFQIVLHSSGATYKVKRSSETNYTNILTFDGGNNLPQLKIGIQANRTGSATNNYTAHKNWKVYTPNLLYVNKTSTGTGTGDSWANAIPELADALKWAQANKDNNLWDATDPLKIFVAGGTYKPLYSPADNNFGNSDSYYNAFLMVKNVQLYGGFAGTETTLAERDLSIAANASILSSDVNGDDAISGSGSTLTISNTSDNNLHVVVAVGDMETALLDGFTLTGGNANSGGSMDINGKSVYNSRGGGIYCRDASPALNHVIITGNNSDAFGGGLYNDDSSSPTLLNTLISQNISAKGAGVCNDTSDPQLTNVTIAGNKSTGEGGGIYNSNASPEVNNGIVYGNSAVTGAEVYTDSGSPTFSYSLISGSGGSANWDSTFGTDGGNNIDEDPLFTDAGNGDYSLRVASPARDAGSNSHYTGLNADTKDLAGNPRVYKYSDGGVVDMGAYEAPQISPDANNIIYVSKTATGNGSGDSWANAIPELSDALQWAQANKDNNLWDATDPLKIFVAKGTYKPGVNPANNATETSKDVAFLMVKDVQLYGGFAGTESTLAERDLSITANASILSSDVNGDDVISGSGSTLSISNISDNNYHVVLSAGDVGNALLDGFTITGGYASTSGSISVNGKTVYRNRGGGMFNYSSSPTLTNVTINGNTASFGGGMFNSSSSSPALTNVTISNNTASSNGGGMFNSLSSSPALTNVTISNNTASSYGGGMCNSSSSLTLTNVTISNNTASSGGGMYNYSSSPTLTNVTINSNTASSDGGGMYNNYSSPSPKLYNSIVWGNIKAGNSINNIYNASSTPMYTNSLVQGSGGSGAWNSTFGTDGGNNIDEDPLFTDAGNGDYSLQASSPAINTGANSFYTGLDANTKDLAGNARVYKYSDGGVVDMGAYEYQGEPIPQIKPDANNIIYVKENATGDGSSWSNTTNLATALKWAQAIKDNNLWDASNPLKIFVAGGTYKPGVNPVNNATETSKDVAFLMVKDVQLFGGFAGTESALAERDLSIAANASILSSDVNGDDIISGSGSTLSISNISDNNYHVVLSAGDVGNALLDGFTITGGNAGSSGSISVNGKTINRNYGGGMFNYSSSPALTNVTINSNTASKGGGMYNYSSSSPALTNVTINSNTASKGGGMYNSLSSPTLTNVAINGNTASSDGGGMCNSSSSLTLTNVTISNNTASSGGGMYNYLSSPTLTNVTINSNTASSDGGGMYNNYSSPSPTLYNSIVWGNKKADNSTNNIYNASSTPMYTNSLIGGSGGSTGWDSTFGTDGGNNIDEDPLFTDAANGDYSLQATSPAINTGANSLYTGLNAGTKDLAGNARVYKYSDGGVIDMGAYEFTPKVPTLSNFDNIAKTYGDADFALTPPTSDSDGAFTYTSSDEDVAIIDGGTVKITGAGTAEITATQASTANYGTGEIKLALTVEKDEPTLSNFDNIAKTYGDADFALTPPTSDSDGAFTYTSSDEDVAIIDGGTVKITGAGTAEITATQASTANYGTGEIKLALTVEKDEPTLSNFDNIAKTYGDADFALTPPTSDSDGAFTYTSSDEDVAIIDGGTVKITGAGTAEITATQASTANYGTGEIKLALTVEKATLTITAQNKTMQQGNALPTFTATYTGFANSEDESVLTAIPVFNTTATTASAPGTYDIEVSGAEADNYAISYQNGTLTVEEGTLPVTLIYFTAKAEGNHAQLQWQTATETNNKGFEIYRSGDDGVFVKLGNIQATQYTVPSTQYSFTDKQPLNGNNYYKLIQVDNEGTTAELGIKQVSFVLRAPDIRLYPNPTDKEVNITYQSGKYSYLTLSDLNGKVLQELALNPDGSSATVSLGNYPAGTYLLRLSGNSGTETRKVVKR